jgi:hypothetical protein
MAKFVQNKQKWLGNTKYEKFVKKTLAISALLC